MFRVILGGLVAVLLGGGAFAAPQPPPPVEDYGRMPAMAHVTLSPAGQRYAFVETLGGKSRLVIADTNNHVLQAYRVGALKMEGLRWAGEDHLLLFTSVTANLVDFRVEKNELAAVVVVSAVQNKAFSVFQTPVQTKVATAVFGTYGSAEIDGHWYGFFGGLTYNRQTLALVRPNPRDGFYRPDLYKVDLDTGAISLAASGQEQISGWLVSRQGKVAARLLYNQTTGAWRLYPSDWGGEELAKGTAPIHDVSIAGFGRTAGEVLLESGGAEHDVLQEISLADGQVKATYDADKVGAPLYDRTTGLWVGETYESDDARSSKFYAPEQEAKLSAALRVFPKLITRLISYSADFNRMILFTEGGDDSGTYWIVDIARHTAQMLGCPYPTIVAAHVGPVRWVGYKAADGLAMKGVLTLPPGRAARNLPLVVMPHGGPEAHDMPGFHYWAQAFAARGYAVWQPNFRGSDGSGNAFRDAGYGQWGRKMQTDISDGVSELVRQGLVDPKRACIVGASYGGYAALAGVTLQHGLYRCAASYGGVADLDRMLDFETQRTGDFSATMRFWKKFMGAKTSGGSGLGEISPDRLADQADSPILLIHGVDDTVVPIDQSQAMERALKRAGKPVELVTLPGADHWLLEEPARIAMVKATVAFVLAHNPPDPPESPASGSSSR